MPDHRKFDDALAAPLARALASGLDRSGRDCPDAEIFAQYFDRTLAAEESAGWELHFAACAVCQEQLAAMARMESAASPAPQADARPGGIVWLWNWRWLAPAAAALGALAIWVVVNNAPVTQRETLIAQNVEKAPPVPSSQPAAQEPSRAKEAVPTGQDATGKGSEAGLQPRRALSSAAAETGSKRAPETPAAAPSTERVDRAATLRAAPAEVPPPKLGALADKKDEAASQFAIRVDASKTKEEQSREAVKVAEAEARVETESVQLARSDPAAAPAASTRKNEMDSGARDEPKKAQVEPAGQPGMVVIAPAPGVSGLRQEAGPSGRFRPANVAGGKVAWRLGPAGSIEQSTDSGATWQQQVSGVTVDLLAGSAPSPNVCWTVGRGGVVLRTTDGSTWQQLGSPASVDLVAVDASDANQATVTTSEGKRYVTTDGGRTWRSL